MRRCISIFTTIILASVSIFFFSGCESSTTKVKFNLSNDKSITVTLYGKNYAPKTVAHFLELVKSGYYDGTLISSVQSNRLIAGDFTSENGYKNLIKKTDVEVVKGEFEAAGVTVKNNPILHEFGTISLMNIWAENELDLTDKQGNKNTASNIFFFSTEKNVSFDGKYTTFGKITDKSSLETLTELKKLMEKSPMDFDKQAEIVKDIDTVYDLNLLAEPIWITSVKIVK